MPNNIKKDLTLVVVSFNSGKVILDTLSELMEANTCSVIVVDNASTDDSRSLLRDRFPKVSYINLTVNIGYGRAANVALKNIDTDYAVLLNPDVLLSSAALNTIFNRAVRCQEKVAIFSPALKKADHSENGDIFVDYLIGAFLLFRMNALRKVGYFDENFFLFYEEKDLELRLIDNGYKLIFFTLISII
jgi:N-acetylglucosaminyl-diphospho-decaprenol L-rhamnosyltransferase